jgi:thiamine-monophosphate kinase
MREFDFIEKIRRLKPFFFNPVIKGIGDDCAILPFNNTHDMIITADSLCEGVHFKRDYFTPRQIGAKSAAVNISDICAMGGVPKYALVCLGFPKSTDQKYIDSLYGGIMDFMGNYSTDIIGGDTISSPQITISITVIGLVERDMSLRRDRAKAGDRIFVTGFLGDAHAGLKVLSGKRKRRMRDHEYLPVQKHLAPRPRYMEARQLLSSGLVKCCIDLSDGIASDLARVCEQSNAGAVINADNLPVSYSAAKIADDNDDDAADYALYGGEDYELLFTVAEKNIRKFLKFAGENCLGATETGIIRRKPGVYVKRGTKIQKEDHKKTWNHF